jgi:hypothetical protein
MLSLIEVTCPHCSAQGQIMLPPLGAIIVGPCPECQGMVAVFCGRVLPLDKEIMNSEDSDVKRAHLHEILGDFLRERIERLYDESPEETDAIFDEAASEEPSTTELGKIDVYGNEQSAPISQEEFESFRNVDLRLLDNPDYFKAIFDES